MTLDIHFDEMSDERRSRINWKLKRLILAAVYSILIRKWLTMKRDMDGFEATVISVLGSILVDTSWIRHDVQKLRVAELEGDDA